MPMDEEITAINPMGTALSTGQAGTEGVETFVAITAASAAKRARQMANTAALALSTIGVNVANVTPFNAMAFAASVSSPKFR